MSEIASIACPCCHQPINADRLPVTALSDVEMPLIPRLIVEALIKVYPRSITGDQLVMKVYSGAREPEFARNGISVQLIHLRKYIEPYGWTIPRGKGGRDNLARYKLEPLT